jgi:hypothetical protein
VQRDADGGLTLDPPPDNSFTIAGQIEWQLWRSHHGGCGEGGPPSLELDRLLALLWCGERTVEFDYMPGTGNHMHYDREEELV